MFAARRVVSCAALPASQVLPASSAVLFQQRSISHYAKNEKLGRPLSPHVTIYSFPLAAISSVTHRLTGGMLTVGMYGVGIGALAGMDVASLMTTLGNTTGVGALAKFAVAFPLIFHTTGGIRHLYWERYPEGLHQDTQKTASVIVFGVSTVLSVGAALI